MEIAFAQMCASWIRGTLCRLGSEVGSLGTSLGGMLLVVWVGVPQNRHQHPLCEKYRKGFLEKNIRDFKGKDAPFNLGGGESGMSSFTRSLRFAIGIGNDLAFDDEGERGTSSRSPVSSAGS